MLTSNFIILKNKKWKNSDYEASLKINEKIYLELIEKFEKEWIEFAFPSQTIYVKE